MNLLHPLYTSFSLPRKMNNPMGYVPDDLCRKAAREVQHYIEHQEDWQEEISQGKMFGVLVVKDPQNSLGFLAAYSGQIAGKADWDYFVPTIFDYLKPDGHFKSKEEEIVGLNQEICKLEMSEKMTSFKKRQHALQTEKEQAITTWKAKMSEAKQKRDDLRKSWLSPEEHQEENEILTRKSQWMKAELHRKRQYYALLENELSQSLQTLTEEIGRLKRKRKEESDKLQQWLFENFILTNAHGEKRNLIDIFRQAGHLIPPSGAGECCAPKLLNYAFTHHLTPVCIAEFWWGQSPAGEIRQHLQFYPACRGKCHPILQYMLQGIEVADNPYEKPLTAQPEIIYEDAALLVISKPAGMLSVPGKIDTSSVWSWASKRHPEAEGPIIVHRLDMATSGLMLLAKTKKAHQNLQAQFSHHHVRKTYTAILEQPLDETKPSRGTIELPLRPNPEDRPRQMVDIIHGKKAITHYETADRIHIHLTPHTGRTHQLRLHCAHPDGLGIPIKGDTLYGKASDRLYLHAESITFRHPDTGQEMTFTKKPDF